MKHYLPVFGFTFSICFVGFLIGYLLAERSYRDQYMEGYAEGMKQAKTILAPDMIVTEEMCEAIEAQLREPLEVKP